jgi:hypothetical protein
MTEEGYPSNAPEKGWLQGKNLGWLTKGLRIASLGSPLVGAAEVGALGWWLGNKYGHKIQRLVSPKSFKGDPDVDPDYDTPEERKERNSVWGWGLGGLGALAFLAANYRTNAWDKGMLTYSPMSKESSGWDSLTLEDSKALIMSNPDLNYDQRMMSLSLLNTFNSSPTTPINGPTLVGQAIDTGLSAATGAAVGYLTANALGLPNPRSTAILGAVTNTLGVRPALTLSAIFGN